MRRLQDEISRLQDEKADIDDSLARLGKLDADAAAAAAAAATMKPNPPSKNPPPSSLSVESRFEEVEKELAKTEAESEAAAVTPSRKTSTRVTPVRSFKAGDEFTYNMDGIKHSFLVLEDCNIPGPMNLNTIINITTLDDFVTQGVPFALAQEYILQKDILPHTFEVKHMSMSTMMF
jgi:hypothetical protein